MTATRINYGIATCASAVKSRSCGNCYARRQIHAFGRCLLEQSAIERPAQYAMCSEPLTSAAACTLPCRNTAERYLTLFNIAPVCTRCIKALQRKRGQFLTHADNEGMEDSLLPTTNVNQRQPPLPLCTLCAHCQS